MSPSPFLEMRGLGFAGKLSFALSWALGSFAQLPNAEEGYPSYHLVDAGKWQLQAPLQDHKEPLGLNAKGPQRVGM